MLGIAAVLVTKWTNFFFSVLDFRIALCVDGQNRFCVNSHNLLGEEAIKQRHLQLLGYKVVQVKSLGGVYSG